MKQKKGERKEKVERLQAERLASGGGFLIAGVYLLISGDLPTSLPEWGKFVGVFLISSIILFIIIHNLKKE